MNLIWTNYNTFLVVSLQALGEILTYLHELELMNVKSYNSHAGKY